MTWQLRGALGDEWEWHIGADKPWDAPGWLPARVPGSVMDDLWRAGAVPGPYREQNSLLLEWVPERSWIYRRRFSVREGARAAFRFEGVDYAASVFVDGEAVAGHEGLFTPWEADVSRWADEREHVLAVVVHPAPESEPQVGRTSRVRVHKPRMNYGWDFCPRLVHQGIWRPVTLHVDDPLAEVLAATTADGLVELDVRLRGAAPGEAELVATIGETRAERTIGLGEPHRESLRLRVERPRLWWPNGLGEQHLYDVRVELGRSARTLQTGFRALELVPNEGAPDGALPYTAVANGVRMYLKGWNWVPLDALYGVPRAAKLAHVIELARAAHVNLLRVWGGGLIETPEFYELCDRAGLLVWQEFSLSSSGMESVPSEDEAYLERLFEEAREIVPRKRHHPSLALWCGGNELADRERPLDESAPALRALRDVVRKLDPGRPWLPTSPSGPRFLNRLDVIEADPDGQHDVHGPWEHQGLEAHYTLYNAGASLLHSEFGVEGMANTRTLDALVAPAHRWPADRSNPVYEHLGAWWNNAPLVRTAFGGHLHDIHLLRRASQLLQYDGLRYAVEASLRRAPRSSGTIPWQFNESYPNAWCTAAVDHRGDPKPAYYGVRRAYRPEHVSASFERVAWGGHRTFRAAIQAADASARVVDAWGNVAAELDGQGCIRADLASLESDVFFLDLRLGKTANRYVMSRTADLAPLLDLEPATVAVYGVDAGLVLRHEAGPAAPAIVLEDGRDASAPGWVVFDDNVVDLLPGESRQIAVEWRYAPPPRRAIRVSGWNVEPVVVT